MNETILETKNFIIEVPTKPFVDRTEGGHLRIMSKIQVRDRTKLSTQQALEYTLLSMLVGEALEKGMLKRGIEIGIVNYQEMGNWSVFKPEGVTIHMHIFGRAKTVSILYDQSVTLRTWELIAADGVDFNSTLVQFFHYRPFASHSMFIQGGCFCRDRRRNDRGH